MPLDLDRQHRFLNLAAEAPVRAVEKEPAGKLHGQRARALFDAVVRDVVPRRFEHARKIHSPMLLEMLILGRQNRTPQQLRNLPVGQKNPALDREGSDGLPIVGIKFRHDVRPVILQSVDFRQVARINKQQAQGRAKPDRAQH